MRILIILMLACSSLFAGPNLNKLNPILGCYSGVDQLGVKTRANLSKHMVRESFYELSLDKEQVEFLEMSFYQPKKDAYLFVNFFEDGDYKRSRLNKNRISYLFDRKIRRSVHGEFINHLEYRSNFTVTRIGKLFIFEVDQTDNSEFLSDRYNGNKLIRFKKFTMKKVDC